MYCVKSAGLLRGKSKNIKLYSVEWEITRPHDKTANKRVRPSTPRIHANVTDENPDLKAQLDTNSHELEGKNP